MSKIIDYGRSFFHGFPINEPDTCETAIKELESMLKIGYIFNRETLEKQNGIFIYSPFEEYQRSNNKDEISVSVFPGINSYLKPKDAYSVFQLTNERFYLILSEKLRNDFKMRESKYNHEYYLKGNIPLYEYLLGIGNAGYEVNHILNYLYYVFKYYNGEIGLDEYILKSERYWEYDNYRDKKYKSVYEAIDNCYSLYPNFVETDYNLDEDLESYIYREEYYLALKEICLKYGIDMFDSRGNLIDEQAIYSRISEMIAYVKEQYKVTSEERIKYIKTRTREII